MKESVVSFPPRWISSALFEGALRAPALKPHEKEAYAVRFVVPASCAIMVDAGAKLLSMSNQLCQSTKGVVLDFQAGPEGTMGYLDRMGFFDLLDKRVEVRPERPLISGALLYGGANTTLVEFRALRPSGVDKSLPDELAESLKSAASKRKRDVGKLGDAAFTVFSELIQNVYRHSSSTLDGYAALQLYARGGKVTVCVSDSGLGVMKTLRPSLKTYFPRLASKSDADLLTEMVSKGVSRFGPDAGCGIRQCARRALTLGASMEIRMPTSRVVFEPSSDRRYLGIVTYSEDLPLIWGTHICLDFQLDSLR